MQRSSNTTGIEEKQLMRKSFISSDHAVHVKSGRKTKDDKDSQINLQDILD